MPDENGKRDSREPVLVILGPTGVGKSRVAYELALRLGDVEIISADARAIYRGLDIGTDKPPKEWRERVPHHLIDIKEPHERYSAMDFRRDALWLIDEILKRNRRPIVVGGSTLYLDALFGKLFEGPPADLELRKTLQKRPLPELYDELKRVDLEAAQRIHPNDRQRIVRALEVYQLTGKPISELQKQLPKPPYEFLKVGLTARRDVLYERIDRRVDEMMQRGLLDEVKALQPKVPKGSQAYKSNAYRELFLFLEGKIPSLEEAVRLIKKHTRGHARRQLIYFKRDPEIIWIDTTNREPPEIAQEILDLLE